MKPTADRSLTRELAGTRATPKFTGRCVYCGSRCVGRACGAHRDLVQIETEATR